MFKGKDDWRDLQVSRTLVYGSKTVNRNTLNELYLSTLKQMLC